jgi:hypothetical protein
MSSDADVDVRPSGDAAIFNFADRQAANAASADIGACTRGWYSKVGQVSDQAAPG